MQGFLRGINFAERTVSVEHEEIPNYMPAMTMPFDVKNMAEVEPLKAGDAIEFQMYVTDDDSWIEGVKKVAASEIQLPARKAPPASARSPSGSRTRSPVAGAAPARRAPWPSAASAAPACGAGCRRTRSGRPPPSRRPAAARFGA